MDQIELKRGKDHRAIAVHSADPKQAFAAAHQVIDEWSRTPAGEVAEQEMAAADVRVNAAEEALAQATRARDDLAKHYNTADNSPKGSTTKRTGNQKKAAKSSARKAGGKRK